MWERSGRDVRDGPADEGETHARRRGEEEFAAAETVDEEGGADGDDQFHDRVAAVQLEMVVSR